jgi:hypothetical protein
MPEVRSAAARKLCYALGASLGSWSHGRSVSPSCREGSLAGGGREGGRSALAGRGQPDRETGKEKRASERLGPPGGLTGEGS